ncbi:nucleolar protein 6 [Condylostylus longicornis]|uniref:nucleolar protein 6 n=1 Tax=Condylostylus longicornis TaxID=2530218 RepID=UPI00244E3C2D|nr:nucleolar protein 6 [Condylostylus longicornis]
MLKISSKKKNYVLIDKNNGDDSETGSMVERIENDSKEEFDVEESDSTDGFSGEEFNEDARENGEVVMGIKRKYEPKSPKQVAGKKLKIDANNSKNLYKPATVEEINRLRETETQFHSNLFRMQIEEIIQELKIKEKVKIFVNDWLSQFNAFLDEMESQTEKLDSCNLTWVKACQFKSPFRRKNTVKQKFQFQFLKPSKPAVFVGSFVSNTIIDSLMTIDICVEMPAKTFQKGDYLNLIYEEKRSLYILYLAHKMVESKKYNAELIHYNYFQNNSLKPVLEVSVDGKYQDKVKFRIFPVPEDGSFKLNRFVPWNSNIRSNLFDENTSKENEIFYATPYYNSNILFDITMKKNSELIQTVISNNKNLQEGLILLKIWLKQRNLNEGLFSFNNHVMVLFVVWLYRHRKLYLGMSNYQIARNVWHQLASSSWNEETKGLSLHSKVEDNPNQPNIDQMHQYFDLVFIDCTGFLNVCANMSLDIYLRIKYEANRVIDLLNDNKINSFQELFMTKIPHHIQFDHVFGFKYDDIKQFLQTENQKPEYLNFAGDWLPDATKQVINVLRKGLSNRVLSITPLEKMVGPWSIKCKPPKSQDSFRIGIVLNLGKALDVLDKGPQANDATAPEFRSFWGNKSELRRFQDGSITEACVWGEKNDTLKEKRLIVKQIIFHLLQLHFNIKDVWYLADQFDNTYELDKEFISPKNLKLNAEYCAIDVIKNFDDIGKKLRALQELPLDVTGVQGISPVFRYVEPVPILNNATFYTDIGTKKLLFRAYNINEGIIELGTSGKWPNDLSAFRRIKTAFHIKIANSLMEVYKLKTRGGIDGIHILNNGYLYKIEISHPKEIALLKKTTTEKGVIRYVDTEESIQLEKRLIILPKVTSALHGLYQQFSCYGPTVMIAKRWLNSQLIDSYLWPDECTELLVAYQFLKSNSLPNPCQPQIGFLRFLNLLTTMNWQTDMFILNFNDDMTQQEIADLEEKFSTKRDTFPLLFIATSFDEKRYGTWWGKTAPNIHILCRVVTLAKHALEILQTMYLSGNKLHINSLFLPSFDGYDVIIKLNKDIVQKCTVHKLSEIISASNKKIVPTAGFNHVLLGLSELREGYSEFGVFFYDMYGGQDIAVKWKPHVFEPKVFSLAEINGCSPHEDDKIICKPKRFLTDFKVILKGLFEDLILSADVYKYKS